MLLDGVPLRSEGRKKVGGFLLLKRGRCHDTACEHAWAGSAGGMGQAGTPGLRSCLQGSRLLAGSDSIPCASDSCWHAGSQRQLLGCVVTSRCSAGAVRFGFTALVDSWHQVSQKPQPEPPCAPPACTTPRSCVPTATLDALAPARHSPFTQVAFVPQDDTLLSTLTVAECLTYSALLRLQATLTPKQIQVSCVRWAQLATECAAQRKRSSGTCARLLQQLRQP